jgi:hypothetical protein
MEPLLMQRGQGMDDWPGMQDWLVVFCQKLDKGKAHWAHWLSGREWAHVWLCGFTEAGLVTINPKGHHTLIAVTKPCSMDEVLEYITAIDDVIAVVGVTKPAMLERRQARQVIFSCVSVVKDILAIRATFVIFPRQLFDLLRKNGGVLYYSRNQRGGD